MIAVAALTGPLPKVGVVVVALLVAGVLLAGERRTRALAMLGALVLSPVLLLGAIWDSPQIRVVHRHPLIAVVGAVIALALLFGAARMLSGRLQLLGPLAVLVLPFRVPIQAGGKASNLLVPLYLVVAVGALAWIIPVLRDGGGAGDDGGGERGRARDRARARARDRARERDYGPAHRVRGHADVPARPARPPDGSGGWAVWVQRLLALYVVLYGLQATYSTDFQTALQTMVFFYVPFALLYQLLRGLQWTPEMVRNCLRVLVVLAIVFSVIGYVEYATKTIILNSKLVIANDLHTYFTVNSVFFDPDIFGRFLALVMILLAVLLLYERPAREQLVATVALVILWVGLVLTLSRSSLGALLVGLGVLAALRWKPSRALVVAAAVIALGAAAVALSPTTFGLNQGINGASSGRGGLVSGGLSLFSERPVWGWGSGSFVTEYRAHHHATATTLSASHTIPVTIAAEQGLIGELAYLALVIAALACLLRRAREDPLRSAIAAAFAALVFHTMLYADFLEDPVTWTLLGIGVSLAVGLPERARPSALPGSATATAERPGAVPSSPRSSRPAPAAGS